MTTSRPPPALDSTVSERMAGVRQKGTAPELRVRSTMKSLGLRYRLTNRGLPGTPDLANRKQKWALFVHGCYWHRHQGCRRATTPKHNRDFWEAKFVANVARDAKNETELSALGFRVVVVWECETFDDAALERLLAKHLQMPSAKPATPPTPSDPKTVSAGRTA